MDVEIGSPSSTLKRPLPDDDEIQESALNATPKSSRSSSILSSPSSSVLGLEDTIGEIALVTNNSTSGNSNGKADQNVSSGGSAVAKRRKLTVEEKQQKQLEKEAKEKAREEQKVKKAEDKRKKDDEKQKRDDEKRKKDEEREEKRREKELAAQQKDEEKRKKDEEREGKRREKELVVQQKEEEKQKKERAQMRLNSFFTKSLPIAKPVAKKELSEYERYFPPFELASHSTLAAYNRWATDDLVKTATKRLDKLAGQGSQDMAHSDLLRTAFSVLRSKYGPRGLSPLPMRTIMEQLHGSSNSPIDLTEESGPLSALKDIPMKYIHFGEDVRPPYYGTYTKVQQRQNSRKLSRNPYHKSLPEANYDYDSEAEWEEPEEGEDLNSEGEEDSDEEGGDDMDGFLDDEEETEVKRRQITSDMAPVSTGIVWEDVNGVSKASEDCHVATTDFSDFKIQFLLHPHPKSIDPHSTVYWQPEPSARNSVADRLMNPPRLPLSASPNVMVNRSAKSDLSQKSTKALGAAGSAIPKAPKAEKRYVPADQIPQFKEAVSGSDLTKIALVEALKRQFPKVPKDAINNTLDLVATRVGGSRSEKKWVLVDSLPTS